RSGAGGLGCVGSLGVHPRGDAKGRVRRPHPLNGVMRTPSCGWMSRDRLDTQFVIFPAGPSDPEALARVHVQSWRETYKGLLPEAYLARMSEVAHARRFGHALTAPGPDDVTLAAA